MVNFSEHVYSLKYLKLDCLSNMLYKIFCIFNCYRLIGVFVIQNYFRKTHIFSVSAKRNFGAGSNMFPEVLKSHHAKFGTFVRPVTKRAKIDAKGPDYRMGGGRDGQKNGAGGRGGGVKRRWRERNYE